MANDVSGFKKFWLKFRFGLKKRINLYERLMSYLEEGYPVYETLERFKVRFTRNKDSRAELVSIWIEKIKTGAPFSEAIYGWIPDAEFNLIEAGEKGEGLHLGLKEAIKFSEASQKMKAAIIGGSVYPVFLIILCLFFIASFSTKLAPTFKTILPVARWPDDAKMLNSLSEWVVNYWMFLVAGIFTVAYIIKSTIGTFVGRVRDNFDRFPPWSVYKTYQASAFLISLSSMMKSGISLNDSLKSLTRHASPWLIRFLNQMMNNLKRGGKNYGQHLHVGLLDDETAYDVIDYSELGKFEVAVYSIGEKNLEAAVVKIDMQMSALKSIMLIFLAITVGWVYFTNYNLNTTVAESASNKR